MLYRNFPVSELGHKRTTELGTVGKAWAYTCTIYRSWPLCKMSQSPRKEKAHQPWT